MFSKHLSLSLGARIPSERNAGGGAALRPSRCIREMRVVLDNPSLAAAPLLPPTTPLVSPSMASMCARCDSARVRAVST